MWRTVTLVLIIASLIGFAIYSKSISLSQKSKVQRVAHKFNITTINRDTIPFNSDHFPKRLILNFYSSSCGLCIAEINEIISFSRKKDIDVVFITCDSEKATKNFILELKTSGLKDTDKVSFGKISFDDANGLFGDITVPQTIAFDDGLKIKQIKKGLISSHLLQKAFE